MPPTNFFLAKFPAQIDDSSPSLTGEIAKSEVNVFDDDSQLVNGLQAAADFMESSNIQRSDRAAASRRSVCAGFAHFRFCVRNDGFCPTYDGKPLIELRKELVGLGQCKNAVGGIVI